MTRLGEYREFVEERDLIEEALLLLEERNVSFWKTGLRIGNDLLGLSFQMPRGGPRQIERLRTYEGTHKKPLYKLTDYQLAKRHELRQVISHLDPFFNHKDGGYMEVVGHPTNNVSENGAAFLAQAFVDRLDKRVGSNQGQTKSRPITNSNSLNFPSTNKEGASEVNKTESADTSQPTSGIHLSFSSKRLFFKAPLSNVTTSILTLYNQGSVAIRFQWVKMKKSNPLSTQSPLDGVQRFFLSHREGVILPNTAYDFPIIFKSSSPGLFTEIWRLETLPNLPHLPDLCVTLQGLGVEVDIYHDKRTHIDKTLERRHTERVARKVIDEILDAIASKTVKHTRDPNWTLFERRNRELNLSYNFAVNEKLEALADATYKQLDVSPSEMRWNRSVSSLYEMMALIPQTDIRSNFIGKLNQLVSQATESNGATKTSTLYVIW